MSNTLNLNIRIQGQSLNRHASTDPINISQPYILLHPNAYLTLPHIHKIHTETEQGGKKEKNKLTSDKA